MRTALITALALALSGCATTYDLQLMPRDSGKMYHGVAEDSGSGEGRISITIDDKAYNGTWVATTPDRTNAYVSGGFGWGRRGGSIGTIVTMDNPQGSEAKALLSSSDGAGLRCDFTAGQGRGGGVCRDDKGREYDVQLRAVSRR
jgi:hypothetical protein